MPRPRLNTSPLANKDLRSGGQFLFDKDMDKLRVCTPSGEVKSLLTPAAVAALGAESPSAAEQAALQSQIGGGTIPAFGEISVTGGSTAQTSIGTSYVKVTGFDTNGPSLSSTPDATNDKITLARTGYYQVTVTVGFSGTGNATFTGAIFLEGVETSMHFVRKIGSGGDVGSTGIVGILDVTAEDQEIDLRIKSDGASDSITLQEGHMTVFRIGDT